MDKIKQLKAQMLRNKICNLSTQKQVKAYIKTKLLKIKINKKFQTKQRTK